jgi:flagellar biosynthesis/type III secretory pathway chaperone
MISMSHEQTNLFQDLVDTLSKEVDLYSQLEQLLKDKQSSIINGNVDKLQKIVHEEQRLIPKIRMATQSREQRATTIGAMMHLATRTPSLSELIDLSPSHHVQQMLAFRAQLIKSLDQIAHANRENEFLLNSSVELVRGLVQVLLGKEKNENLHYGGRGKLQEDPTRRANVDYQI